MVVVLLRLSKRLNYYHNYGGGGELADGYSKGTGLGAEIIGTFVFVYTIFSATDPKRNARDSHVPVSTNYLCYYNTYSQLLYGVIIDDKVLTIVWTNN